MSGGHWGYKDSSLMNDVFCYGEDHRSNPLQDIELSELLWDLLNLLHDYDWYISADTSKEIWLKAAQTFKQKWLRGDNTKHLETIIDRRIEDVRQELKELL